MLSIEDALSEVKTVCYFDYFFEISWQKYDYWDLANTWGHQLALLLPTSNKMAPFTSLGYKVRFYHTLKTLLKLQLFSTTEWTQATFAVTTNPFFKCIGVPVSQSLNYKLFVKVKKKDRKGLNKKKPNK